MGFHCRSDSAGSGEIESSLVRASNQQGQSAEAREACPRPRALDQIVSACPWYLHRPMLLQECSLNQTKRVGVPFTCLFSILIPERTESFTASEIIAYILSASLYLKVDWNSQTVVHGRNSCPSDVKFRYHGGSSELNRRNKRLFMWCWKTAVVLSSIFKIMVSGKRFGCFYKGKKTLRYKMRRAETVLFSGRHHFDEYFTGPEH